MPQSVVVGIDVSKAEFCVAIDPSGERWISATTPLAIDALVELGRKITGKDFAAEARTLEHLGLGGMGGPQIRRVVEQGFC